MIKGLRILRGLGGSIPSTTILARRTSRFAALAALAALVAACGGGGGGGGGFIPEDPNANLTSYTLDLELIDESGSPVREISSTRPATLRAIVREDNRVGAPVEGVLVTLDVGFASVSPDNGTAVTDSTGVATFVLTGGTISGGDVANVFVESPAGTVSTTFAFQIREPFGDNFSLTLALINDAGEIVRQVDRTSPVRLQALLTRSNNDTGAVSEPVQDAILELTADDAVITPENGRTVTDEQGIAQFGLAAGAAFGAQLATVSYTAPGEELVQATIPFEVVPDASGAGLGSLDLELRLVDANGVDISRVTGAQPGIAEVRVFGAGNGTPPGTPISGIPVSVTSSNAVLSPASGSVVTNAQGIARFSVSAGDIQGADLLTATVLGPLGPITDTLQYNLEASVVLISLDLLDPDGQPAFTVRDDRPLTLRVRARSAENGSPVSGAVIEATTATALLRPENGRVVTDASGIAEFVLEAGATTGGDTVVVRLTTEEASIQRSVAYQVVLPGLSLSVQLFDPQGLPTDSVSSSRPGTLQVQVASTGNPPRPVSGLVVSATSELGLAQVDSATALTNSAGVATFQLGAGTANGADRITVSLDVGDRTIESSIGVSVAVDALSIGGFVSGEFVEGELGLTVTSLPPGGSSRITVAVVDGLGEPTASSAEVRFSSQCSLDGVAGFRLTGDAGTGSGVLVAQTVQGFADVEYVGGTCTGTDVITATLLGDLGGATATGSVNIAPLNARFVGFFSADPAEGPESGDRTVIALAQTGGRPGLPESALITFEVLTARPGGDLSPSDAGYLQSPDRTPVSNTQVRFRLTNQTGDIELCSTSGNCTVSGSVTGTTDASGLVSVEVRSGNVPASTFVVATYTDPDNGFSLDAGSNEIVVSTGLPDQNSFSLSVEEGFYVADAANVDGVERVITARVADRFNNPVPDGTAVIWRTEYGAIDASCETGRVNGERLVEQGNAEPSRGTCSVLWTSQAPRVGSFPDQTLVRTTSDDDYDCPSHTAASGPCPNDLGPLRGNRSTILAYALGEEDFVDGNGNGLYDSGESFLNLPEAFLDRNEDFVFTPFATTQNLTTACTQSFDGARCEASGAEEEFIDLDRDGVYDDADGINGNTLYNGTLCSPSNDAAGVCERELVHVRGDFVLTLSTVGQNLRTRLVGPDGNASGSVTGSGFTLYVADLFNNRPGNGSTLEFRLSDGEACGLNIGGEELGGAGATEASLTLNFSGDRAGAASIPVALVRNEDGVAGTITVLAGGFQIGQFGCP